MKFDTQGKKTILIIDTSLHSRRIISVLRYQEPTAEEGYAEWRYRFLAGIFGFIKDFKADEVILALDSKPYWRKEIYPFYKVNRKTRELKEEKENKDWFEYEEYYKNMDEFIGEIKKNLPFKIVESKGCEADDIAGVLCYSDLLKDFNKVVVTNDSDYLQLLQTQNTFIYNPTKREFMTSKDPKKEMLMKICLGDDSDSIPSIENTETYKEPFLQYCVEDLKIADNEDLVKIKFQQNENLFMKSSVDFQRTYGIKGTRSHKFSKKKATELINSSKLLDFLKESENKEIKEKFMRNNQLINLQNQPKEIKNLILKTYQDCESIKTLKNLYGFCIKYKFRGFLEDLLGVEKTLSKLV